MPMIPADKANHAVYGALLFVGALALARLLGLPEIALQLAWLVTACAALGKEALDAWANHQAEERGLPPPHGVELLDAAATLAGAALCHAAAFMI